MQRTGRKLRKTLKALTDPQPEFVSLVFGGANKSPFRAIRSDGTVTGEGDDMTTEVTIKAETHEIARVEFAGDKFADETAVKAWLADGGYSDDLTVTKTDGGFEVADPAIDADADLTEIDLTDVTGVKVYAVKQAEAEVLELTEKTDGEVNPGAIDEVPAGVQAVRSAFDGAAKAEAPVLLDATMALYNAIRSDLLAGDIDTARAVINEFAVQFDNLVEMAPPVGEEEAVKDDMTSEDVANAKQNPAMGFKGKGSKKKPNGVVNDKQNTDDDIVADGGKPGDVANPKGAHSNGKITAGDSKPDRTGSAVHADHNTDDTVKPNAPTKPGTKVHEQQNEGGKINPNGGMATAVSKRAEFFAAIAPEIEVAKEDSVKADEIVAETETAEKAGKPAQETDSVDDATSDNPGKGKKPAPGGDDNEGPIAGDDMTNDQGDRKAPTTPDDDDDGDEADDKDGDPKVKKKEDEISDEAAIAVKSEDPLAQLTALVGTLATSVKAMQDSMSERHEEVVQRVAAMEDVRQTRKGADVDETGTASPSVASENSRKMAQFRTNSVLGRRRPLSD